MQLSEQTQAILLLTAWFGKQDSAGPTPLTPTEWGRFALFLLDINRKPADLLHVSEVDAMLASFDDKRITAVRVRKLLERSAALGIALEKWQRAGLWVMTRSDPDYPRRWKQRLKSDAPPVLFGSGNRDFLNRGGIAVVGSRDLDESQVEFTGQLGRGIAYQGQTVISGGARGADEAAMLGALESEGMAIGVLADSLLRACTSSKYRRGLMSKDLALISPFNPEAGFNVGNAMARNKYIYCLSDAAIVIAATEGKGGTWAGAVEDLKKGWVPLWVRKGNVPGNMALVSQGAKWLSDDFDVRQLVLNGSAVDDKPDVSYVAEDREVYVPSSQPGVGSSVGQDQGGVQQLSREENGKIGTAVNPAPRADAVEAPYQIFLRRLGALLDSRALTAKEIQKDTELKPKVISEWLKQAEADGVVVKTRSPVKYQLRTDVAHAEKVKKPVGKKKSGAGRGNGPDDQAGFGF